VADLLARIEHQILTRRLVLPRQKVLVAVSGGLDSMVLLHSLAALAGKFRWRLAVGHFNHHLRGSASRADALLVRRFAERQRLPFYFGEAFVEKLAKQGHVSVEMAARTARHEFLALTARAQKISTVALAHHADDQVELFFLRLFRGGGGEGLAGMKWQSPSPFNAQVRLVRPLLDSRKDELRAFAALHKIPFREDASNDLVKIPRNKVRHELLPWLRKHYQPDLDRSILRAMDIVGAEAEVLAELSNRWLAEPSPAFDQLSVAIQRRVIQSQLNTMRIPADFDRIEQFRVTPNIPVNVVGNLFIVRDMDGRLVELKHPEMEFNHEQLVFSVQNRQGKETFGGKQFIWKVSARGPAVSLERHPNVEQIDVERVGKEICLRHWRAGDRFHPIGLKSAVKLQDLFTNAKIPREARHGSVVAMTADGRIFWVEGLRLGEQFKVTPETKWILNWRWAERTLK
jgi:tRNA(Ile)-lysidine synthase